MLIEYFGGPNSTKSHQSPIKIAIQAIEALINEGWITAKIDKKAPKMTVARPAENDYVHINRDKDPAATGTEE